jgi:hypothetical protein
MWCGGGLFLGGEKHAMDFNFIFHADRSVRPLFEKVSGICEWDGGGGGRGLIVNDSPDLKDLANGLHFPYWDDSVVSMRESGLQSAKHSIFSNNDPI